MLGGGGGRLEGWRGGGGGGGQSCHHSPVPVCELFVPKYCLIRLIKTNLPTLSVWLSRNKVLRNKNRALYERAYCDRVVFLFCFVVLWLLVF